MTELLIDKTHECGTLKGRIAAMAVWVDEFEQLLDDGDIDGADNRLELIFNLIRKTEKEYNGSDLEKR